MRIERTKNAARNIVFGVALKIYQIIIPFLMRTVMLYFMGIQYLGLSSLFASILQVLNLAELGVGSAMVYSMYKPIADDNKKEISALLRLYKIYYRVIGLVVAVSGLILTPFVTQLIKGDVPKELNVYALYLLNLLATVLSYWLFAYKNSLFAAHQRIDVPSRISLVTVTLQYGLQLLTICIFKNYYLYVIVILLTQVLTNVITAIAATKMYPDYKPEGALEKKTQQDINHRIRDLFTSKIGSVVINSVDTIVISAFLGLTILAIYQNYFFVLSSIIGIVTIVFNACTAGIGNSVIVETKEKNIADLKKFTFIICWIAGFCTACLLCMYQPFMTLWTGEELKLSFSVVVCLCVYYYVFEINQLLNTYKDAAGIWHEDRFRPLITAGANLTMNLVMVQFCGLYGVVLSTVISMLLIGMPWLLHNLFTVLFDRSYMKEYIKCLLFYTFAVAVTCTICELLCNMLRFNAMLQLIVNFLICCVIGNAILFILLRKRPEFVESVELIDKMTKNKLNLKKIITR